MEINGMLFDLGGTLFSYAGQRQMGHAIFEVAEALGLKEERRKIGAAWHKAGESVMRDFSQRDYFLHRDLFVQTLKTFASSFDVPVPEPVAERFHSSQRAAVVDHLPIRPDCLETLRTLKTQGVYLAIVSNIDDDYLDPLVEKHGLAEVLDHWTSSEEAQSCKPHTAIYHYALKKAGLSSEETLFVGDSLHHDIAGASAAGLRSARIIEEGITTPLTSGLKITAQPDYEINELAQLTGIVESVKTESHSES
ncbi:MAG TPA: HAD family hydrolase [Myxococcales bacterium]|nr:HAD family hydrolase [Myxococcales bacterium]HIK85526.1 HAD family hydrolase [Myxococcales bacterium]